MKLVEIKEQSNILKIDLVYASSHNFTGQPAYDFNTCYLHKDAANLLKKALKIAQEIGFGLKIFDSFRPIEVQRKLWQHTPNPEFLSNPDSGAVPHCRGVAVDLTLIDNTGNELDMGTKFDEFTKLSYHGAKNIPIECKKNRFLLMGIMTTAGWDFYRNEWWHYQLFSPKNYPILSRKEIVKI